MIAVRRAGDRGSTKLQWLVSYHTFSFGQYHDPSHSGFRSLRVINEDRVYPEGGFPTHSHKEMEILTFVIEGALEHRDNLGNHLMIRRGEIQLMSAGTGVQHSEFNPSENDPAHFLQIWITPEKKGLSPSYQQKFFPDREKKNTLRIVASPNGREGSLKIHQAAEIYLSSLDEGESIFWDIRPERGLWIQVIRGEVALGSVQLMPGDGASIENETRLAIEAKSNAEFFLFDLI